MLRKDLKSIQIQITNTENISLQDGMKISKTNYHKFIELSLTETPEALVPSQYYSSFKNKFIPIIPLYTPQRKGPLPFHWKS